MAGQHRAPGQLGHSLACQQALVLPHQLTPWHVMLSHRVQERVLRTAGFFCCKKVKEGEDGGVAYAPYLADPSPARRALLRALGGHGE